MDKMSTNQVAAYIGTPIATLRWWRHENKGPKSFRLGRRVVYARADVDRWVAEQRSATIRGA
jgi:predicted DNA-binding transcriptional regulator AlpA